MSKYKLTKKGQGNAARPKREDRDWSAARGMELSVEELRGERDFGRYLLLLKKFAQRYCIIVTAVDTPCGPFFSPEVSRLMTEIGFRVELHGQYRRGYVAVINAGELVYEEMSADVLTPVEHEFEYEGHKISLLSVGFDAKRPTAARINIDGQEFPSVPRGLNFVVYDLVTDLLLDYAGFDTFVESFACHRPADTERGIREYIKQNPRVAVCCFGGLPFPAENRTENEKFIQDHSVSRSTILDNIGTYSSALEVYYEKSDIPELFRVPKSFHGVDGARRYEDIRGKNLNVLGGHRVTTGQPVIPKRSIRHRSQRRPHDFIRAAEAAE